MSTLHCCIATATAFACIADKAVKQAQRGFTDVSQDYAITQKSNKKSRESKFTGWFTIFSSGIVK